MTKKKTTEARAVEAIPVGRPTNYRTEYCQKLITHCKKGGSFESFGSVVSCGRATLYLWLNAHPEFMDARREGLEHCTHYYEQLGLALTTGQLRRVKSEEPIIVDGKPVLDPNNGEVLMKREYEPTQGNSASLVWLTKNIIGWKDKREIKFLNEDDGPPSLVNLSDEQLEAKIQELISEVTKEE